MQQVDQLKPIVEPLLQERHRFPSEATRSTPPLVKISADENELTLVSIAGAPLHAMSMRTIATIKRVVGQSVAIIGVGGIASLDHASRRCARELICSRSIPD